ncbi:MAG: helix-turn-helix domain-containing protein [Anaerolineaceae bacterium]|nr:helix-turn-helix domain-containing protein [Anaerolineaceae bacterium]
MILSLQKGLRILEFLAMTPERPWPLGKIASNLGLHKATCAHVLKTLVELNYAEQVARRKGYQLGPMAFFLTRKGPYRKGLMAVVEPLMAEFACEVREMVNLATLNQNVRFNLCQIDGTQGGQVNIETMVVYNGLLRASEVVYRMASGRLLLAHLSAEKLEAFIRSTGLPGKTWPEVKSKKGLYAALYHIRQTNMAIYFTDAGFVSIACPVVEDDKVVAALGIFLPEYRFSGKHKEAILKGIKKTAEEISAAMSALSQTHSV